MYIAYTGETAVGMALPIPVVQNQMQALRQTAQCLDLLLMCRVTLPLMRTAVEVCLLQYDFCDL